MSDETIGILVAIGVAVLLVAVLLIVWAARRRRRRSERLHDRFGPEYDRTVEAADGRRERRSAEAELSERVEQRDRLEIRPLSRAARERYAQDWQQAQARFVDMPAPALDEADALLEQVMSERGYPVEGFEGQAALISVDHPQLVQDYRDAHAIRDELRRGAADGDADTEKMRRAMLRYRSLFDELLAPEDTPVS